MGLQQLEAQRQAVLDKGDVDSAMKHEMQILATLLNSQFGQAHVDHQQDLVMLQVTHGYTCILIAHQGHCGMCQQYEG